MNPVAVLGGITLTSLLSLHLLGGASPKQIEVETTCKGLQLPLSVTWPLPPAAEIHARGFNLEMENIAGFSASSSETHSNFTSNARGFRTQPNSARLTEPPSLTVRWSGRLGAESAVGIPFGTMLTGTTVNPEFGAGLRAVFPLLSGQILIKADTVSIPEINRSTISGWAAASPLWRGDTVSVAPKSNGVQMMICTLRNDLSSNVPAEADFRYPQSETSANLPIADMSADDTSIRHLTILRSINATVRVGSGNTQHLTGQFPVDIVADVGAFRVLSMALVRSTGQQPDTYRIVVRFSGVAHSLTYGAENLLPSHLKDVWSAPIGEKGGALVIFGVAAFVMVVLLMRAVEALADMVLPHSEKGVTVMKTIAIHATGQGNVINVADYMRDVVNTVSSNSVKGEGADQIKPLMDALARKIAEIAPRIDTATAQQMGSDVKTLSEELKQESPRSSWLNLSLTGIKEAALKVGEIAKPVLETVELLSKLLIA
ncbi:MAG TPA: hypothetical protein VME17_14540 [Bryobacteraceae bacterium]|nr:hypothetical protein [Bryobacteraceae bacterium]